MHINRMLPPVDIVIQVFVNNEWVEGTRVVWATKSDSSFDVVTLEGRTVNVPRSNMQWKYP